MVYLFIKSVILKVKNALFQRKSIFKTSLEKSLIVAIIIFSLFATGAAYQGHHLFDIFRIPARALPFIALCATIYVFSQLTVQSKPALRKAYLLASVAQVSILSFMIQPSGSPFSPYDVEAQNMAEILKVDDAKSVWISMDELNNMYIQAVLTQNGISLPNVYYGDMGQRVEFYGNYCGYSFDHLIVQTPVNTLELELNSDMEWSQTRGKIPVSNLSFLQTTKIHGNTYYLYRVICKTENQ